MNRHYVRAIAFVALLMFPAAAFAQKEPPHTKQTKDAEKFIGLSMTRQDPAQKRPFLEQALTPLQEAMTKDPQNARVWLLAGTVHAGLGNFAAADSALDRAQELYPGYAELISTERHAAWEAAFNTAVGLINAQKTDEGILALENAELIFPERPEAKYYLGLFYMQKEQPEKAEAALKSAIEAVNGPLRAKLQPAAVQEWDNLATNAKIKISNLVAYHGAALYDKQMYDSAASAFMRARAMNISSRDALFNQLQSVYARALQVDKERGTAKNPALDETARKLNAQIIALTDTLRIVDPNNEDVFFFSSRANKVLSDLSSDPAAKTRFMNALRDVNTAYEKVSFFVADIQIAEADTSATVKGAIINKLLKPGATGTLTFELLGLDGKVIGSAPINFTVPAAAATSKEAVKIPFDVTIPISAGLAGWRYRLK
jgi:tetratricopeptide (TPR) repeat protein